MPLSLSANETPSLAGGRLTFSMPPRPGKSARDCDWAPRDESVSNGNSPTSQSKAWSVRPRPTQPLGFGSPLLSHRRGPSTQPLAMTTTLASSVTVSPVSVSRQVTPRAVARPRRSRLNRIRVANASVTRVTARPPDAHASAVMAMGTYDVSVERFALRLRGAPGGFLQPCRQYPQNVQPVAWGCWS